MIGMEILLKQLPCNNIFKCKWWQNGTTYNFGLGYLNQDGMVIQTGYKRYDAQMNLKTNLGGRVTFGTNINFLNHNAIRLHIQVVEIR